MATSATTVTVANQNFHVFNLIATADADTTLTFAHQLTFTPDTVFITALSPQGIASGWTWDPSATTGTNVAFVKTSTAMGTGNAAAQVRVWVGRLWSAAA